ncbi:MAG: cell division protein FtsL [Halioglobus sp.]|nr:cell division protein FtsL [Halioglobus sp.]
MTPAAGQGHGLLLVDAALLLLIVLSAFLVIHSTHRCRALYAQLQGLEFSQWTLQEDYGRLLLEQSTFASHHRVEVAAQRELNMVTPELARIRVVTP